ncbi:kinesin-domain-containing protein [Linnemannia elongata AG-77]|uniref:Kinesin-domain-containing protein n=1 Tax=Linnemannia elongata AG-77 TaxID=1314771 RepID=A0A197KGX4_9FUNG|nr:kinesin-domain-containing protein [Linnemannia elongata AG-77]
MQGLEVISSLHSLPRSSTSHYKPHGNNTINGTHPNLELELTQAAPVSSKTGDGGDNNTSNQPNGGAGMDVDTGSPSTEAVKGIKRVRETPQWPSESAILVAVRVRPFNASEQMRLPQASTSKFNFSADASLAGLGAGHGRGDGSDSSAHTGSKGQAGIRKVVDVLDDSVLVFDPPDAESISKYKRALLPVQAYRRFKDMRYAFDRVFHEDAQQEEVFENTTRHLIDGVLNGYNGTLFAYGATGCGKTHTISGTLDKPGIIFLTMQELYDRIKEVEDEKTIEVSLSYLEVYNETIRDLLTKPGSETSKPASLHLREDSAKKISIAGLSEHHPKGMDELMDLVLMGNENRTMSPTEANATSSRSHAVLQINICQRLKTANVSEDFTIATLSLIDLAGSERASATKNRGTRLAEGANINKSLLALGNCINALCDNKPKAHIPYRDSKLTRLLKFSLGGNCKTVMIACVSPSSQHYEETHNTLKYANRAKNIKTKVTKNTLNVDRHVSEYVQAIYELRQEVAELKGKLQNQARGEEIERAQQRQDALSREVEETVRKMRATFQTARSQEQSYAQLQSRHFIISARLSGLQRWREGFHHASQAARQQYEQLEKDIKAQGDQGGAMDDEAVIARARKLNDSMNASSSYINMVDNLIQDLNDQTMMLTRQMQEQEDSLKLYAVSIQSIEKRGGLSSASFPYHRLYELEKKCQALESHNKILTTKLELSDMSLSEQFLATEDFMELSAKSLVGLRSEIEAVEQAGLATRTLNDIYMSSITSFTDMTKRIGTSLSQNQGFSGSEANDSGSSSTIGLGDSRLMSILPEVPSTPVKRHSQSNVLPNLSMDTVDTNLALGSSSLYGSQSPSRMFQERNQWGSPQNPFQSPPPAPSRRPSTPRRKSNPMPGVIFSPKRRPRGGLRQHRDFPTPTKRNVNFLLDVVAEDEERYSTGWRDPAQPIIRPTPFPSLSNLRDDSPTSTPPPASSSSSSSLGRVGLGGGAKRLVVSSNGTNGASSGQGGGGARRMVVTSSTVPSGIKSAKGEMSKGPQRLNPFVTGNHNGSPPSNFSSPTKRLRQLDGDSTGQAGKKQRSSPVLSQQPAVVVHGASSATAARIARRQSMMPENRNPFKVASTAVATLFHGKSSDSVMTSPPNGSSSANTNRHASKFHGVSTDAESSGPSSAQGSSRIPIPSPPPPVNGAKKPLRLDKSDPLKSIPKQLSAALVSATSTTSTASTSSATTKRRLSMGSIGQGSGSLHADEGNKTNGGTAAHSSVGSGIGGGPIRDASTRRRIRAQVTLTPPLDIPTFQQLGSNGGAGGRGSSSLGYQFAPGELGAPVMPDSQGMRPEPTRSKRRVSMMAALPRTTSVDVETAIGDDSASSSIPIPVTGSNRRRSLGPIRPLSSNNSNNSGNSSGTLQDLEPSSSLSTTATAAFPLSSL